MANPNVLGWLCEWRDSHTTPFQVHASVDDALAAARELTAERT